MKSLENVVAENAKGILASTMRDEISELVKESMKKTEEDESNDLEEDMDEQEMDDMDSDDDTDSEETSTDDEEDEDTNFNMMGSDMETDDDMDMDSDDDMDMDSEDDMDMDSEDDDEPHVDLTNASDAEILKVFKAMGDEDGIIVKKEGNTIDLNDSKNNAHYKISLGESEEDEYMEMEESWSDEEDESMEMDESWDDEDSNEWSEIDMDNKKGYKYHDDDEDDNNDSDELVFEIEMDDDSDESAEKMETKESFKPKGMGMGKPGKVYPKSLKHGVSEKDNEPKVKKSETKEGMKTIKPKGMGMGKPKFEYKEVKKGDMKPVKNGGETSEASRTLGAGRAFGKNGLPKPKAAPRHLNVEGVNKEIIILRERNEEYRKALNVFKTKLNEVAVFNSNLAYATRLFTEHSTTKQEKINILRRFDSAETLKESKTLYKTVKDELSTNSTTKVVKESLQERIEKTPASGSAVNLIESKTYENPQFMRMKDLMTKMNVVK